ncbi:MAG: hypothetical protein HGA78_11500 [Nitrospirales bacterium]|nr:hypothetical protein [Nitrospirales bacterium]
MTDLEKLARLLNHWMEHNDEHASVYRDWAEKILNAGNTELSKVLGNLYQETKRLNQLFEDALRMIEEKQGKN